MAVQLVETAKVLPKGQITIPKDIRQLLGVETGDRVVLVWDGEKVMMMNPAVYAMRWLGEQMTGKAAEAGFTTEDDVAECITQLRQEG